MLRINDCRRGSGGASGRQQGKVSGSAGSAGGVVDSNPVQAAVKIYQVTSRIRGARHKCRSVCKAGAGRAGSAGRTCCAGCPSGTGSAGRTGGALRSLGSLGADRALRTGGALRSLGSLGADRALRTCGALGTGGTGRPNDRAGAANRLAAAAGHIAAAPSAIDIHKIPPLISRAHSRIAGEELAVSYSRQGRMVPPHQNAGFSAQKTSESRFWRGIKTPTVSLGRFRQKGFQFPGSGRELFSSNKLTEKSSVKGMRYRSSIRKRYRNKIRIQK